MDQPNLAQALALAQQYRQTGRLSEAEQVYHRILSQNPNHLDALNNLGGILNRLGRPAEAIEFLDRAAAIDPKNIAIIGNRAMALASAGRLDEAMVEFQHALQINPRVASIHSNLGNLFRMRGDVPRAIRSHRNAVELSPNDPTFLNNLGVVLNEADQTNDALAALHRAIELRADYPEAYRNLSVVYRDNQRIDEAISVIRQAITAIPNDPTLHWDLARLLLMSGQFAQGWKEFEGRLYVSMLGLSRDFPQPQWNGENITSKTLLVHGEGGFGDTIQFARFVPLLAGSGARIIVECPSALLPLLRDLPGKDAIFARGEALPAFDFHIPSIGLPRVFGIDLSNIPATVPFLRVPMEYQSKWQGRITEKRPRIGIAWSGRTYEVFADETKLGGSELLTALSQIPDVTFYSLQIGHGRDLPRPHGMHLIDLTDDIQDFADTAALVENMDMVISVDTSVAHLAGALGKETWVLIAFNADFRWLMNRTDSPWYPTMRLFRQKTRNDADRVVAGLADSLGRWRDQKHLQK